MDDSWVEQQKASEVISNKNVMKLIRLQQFKKSQAKDKIAKVKEGFEGGIYRLDKAKERVAIHQATITKAEEEIHRLEKKMQAPALDFDSLESMRKELRALRDQKFVRGHL